MNVTLEDAYREACTALGEAIVRERLLTAELSRRQGETKPDEDERSDPQGGVAENGNHHLTLQTQ